MTPPRTGPTARLAPTPQGRIPKASDFLAAELRQAILGDRLEPGTPLPSESELIEQFSLSRGTVREALRLLEAEGLISIKRGAHGGIVVARPDLSQVTSSLAALLTLADAPLRDLMEFRNVIEPVAAGVAAERATDEQRRMLQEAANSSSGYRESGQPFHALVAEATNHELYRVVLNTLYKLVSWHGGAEFEGGGHDEGMQRAHKSIAAAIAAGDSTRAERAMRKHAEATSAVMAQRGGLDRPIVPSTAWRDNVILHRR